MLFSASPCWCCTCDTWWWWGWWWWWWYRLGANRMPQSCLSLHPMECRSLEGAHSAASKAIVCVCVCVSVRGHSMWRVRGVMEGLDWPVEEGGAKGLLHKTKAPYAAASLSLSLSVYLSASLCLFISDLPSSSTVSHISHSILHKQSSCLWCQWWLQG